MEGIKKYISIVTFSLASLIIGCSKENKIVERNFTLAKGYDVEIYKGKITIGRINEKGEFEEPLLYGFDHDGDNIIDNAKLRFSGRMLYGKQLDSKGILHYSGKSTELKSLEQLFDQDKLTNIYKTLKNKTH